MKISRTITDLASFAPTSNLRPQLATVAIQSGRAVATDSYILAEYTPPAATPLDLPGLYSARGMETAGKALGKKYGDATEENGKLSIATETTTVAVEKIEEEYPSYRKIFPKTEGTRVYLNPDYLIKLAKYLKSHGRGNVIALELRGPLDPVVLSATAKDGGKLHGIIMPIRMPSGFDIASITAENA